MASTSSALTEAPTRLGPDGLLAIEDADTGNQVKRMRQIRFPIKTLYGLEFYKKNVLNNMRIRPVLESCFDWLGLGIYKVLGSDPDHFHVLMNTPDAEMSAVTVQLWESGSRVEYYVGSQLLDLNTIESETGLLEVPSDSLAGTQRRVVDMEHGGVTITDARLAFRIMEGLAIMFVFATKDELQEWAKMELPEGRGLERMIPELESSNIGANFIFQN